jgi:hypothetical protein
MADLPRHCELNGQSPVLRCFSCLHQCTLGLKVSIMRLNEIDKLYLKDIDKLDHQALPGIAAFRT